MILTDKMLRWIDVLTSPLIPMPLSSSNGESILTLCELIKLKDCIVYANFFRSNTTQNIKI